jgi:hypothetical protein
MVAGPHPSYSIALWKEPQVWEEGPYGERDSHEPTARGDSPDHDRGLESGSRISWADHDLSLDHDPVMVMPNPVSIPWTIRYALPRPGHVELALYDVRGRKVADLVNGFKDKGSHVFNVGVDGVSGPGRGVYFLRLESAGCRAYVRKIVVR